MEKMKNGKPTHSDNIPAEVWKILGYWGAMILAVLFNKNHWGGCSPSSLGNRPRVPIWKSKGEMTECSNYQSTQLLCHTMKIFEWIINARLFRIVSITLNQCGSVKGSRRMDTIHAAQMLLEKHCEKAKCVHMAFVDLEKAFNCIPHKHIRHALWSHNVPKPTSYRFNYYTTALLAWSDAQWEHRHPSPSALEYIKDQCFHSYYLSFIWTLWSLSSTCPIHDHTSMLMSSWWMSNVKTSKGKHGNGMESLANLPFGWMSRKQNIWNVAHKPMEPSALMEKTWGK